MLDTSRGGPFLLSARARPWMAGRPYRPPPRRITERVCLKRKPGHGHGQAPRPAPPRTPRGQARTPGPRRVGGLLAA
jgi:hypothetical protein